jgi:transcriptional regulator with XRE-family HTH domain
MAALRRARGLSQSDLARLSGLSPGTVNRIERGRIVRPHRVTLAVLAATLGCDPGELLENGADPGARTEADETH